MDRDALYERMLALGRNGVPCTLVVLVEALGSTPQDTGAKMLVTAGGLEAGTVGGGKVEAKAIELARNLLQQPSAPPRLVNWVLKRDVGMTCGGSVKLYFEPRGADGSGADWPIWINAWSGIVGTRSAPRLAGSAAALAASPLRSAGEPRGSGADDTGPCVYPLPYPRPHE